MGKKLAIQGHSTRGKEVIELLEMFGGHNVCRLNGREQLPHWVADNNYICNKFSDSENCRDILLTFTLEEFLEKYPFKVGDKVVYTKFGDNCDDFPEIIESMKWTGTTIEYTFNDCVTCLAKDLKMWKGNPNTVVSGINLNSCNYADVVELNLGNYEIEVRDGRTYAVKKKSKYPTTYNECYNILNCFSFANVEQYNFENDWRLTIKDKNYGNMMNTFVKLLICRDAYWKIAGEEMGLGKPWEPKFGKCVLFDITFYLYQDNYVLHKAEYRSSDNCILVFPVEEMRDAFYENFKELIEQCKELL